MKRQASVQPKTQLKKEELAKLYRQFSRQKYNKYKHQYPRMRESQLVSKIIKEWQAMDSKQKLALYETYSSQKHISDDKSQSSEKKQSPGSSKQKKKKSQSKSVAKRGAQSSSTPTKKSGVRVFVQSSSSKKEKAQSESSDFARDGVKKDFQISQTPESKELGKKVGGKKKRITKQQTKAPRTQYLKFFKFYYDKLTNEHPRWSANQISTIIKLLWKKKISTDKTSAKSTLRAPRQRKRISGRMAFRKTYGYTGIEGAQRWKQLPKESRLYWKQKGEGSRSGQRKVITTLIKSQRVRKGSQSSINSVHSNNFKFFNNPML